MDCILSVCLRFGSTGNRYSFDEKRQASKSPCLFRISLTTRLMKEVVNRLDRCKLIVKTYLEIPSRIKSEFHKLIATRSKQARCNSMTNSHQAGKMCNLRRPYGVSVCNPTTSGVFFLPAECIARHVLHKLHEQHRTTGEQPQNYSTNEWAQCVVR